MRVVSGVRLAFQAGTGEFEPLRPLQINRLEIGYLLFIVKPPNFRFFVYLFGRLISKVLRLPAKQFDPFIRVTGRDRSLPPNQNKLLKNSLQS